jgi:1-deoxy-D-xylulose-5-phosphate synthase
MTEGTGLDVFARRFPRRFFDVGIAEQHAVTFAAGLASEGLRPIVAIYSTFMQRAYDQILHDVCLPDLPVVLALDRSGIVGEDGPTHQGLFDLSYLRPLPNLTLMAPKDERELRDLLASALTYNTPAAIRYPRGEGLGVPLEGDPKIIPRGQWEWLEPGEQTVVLAVGNMVTPAVQAARRLQAEGISVAVINARFIKPLDEALLQELAGRYPLLFTVEENVLLGGFGSAVLEALQRLGKTGTRIRSLGIPDCFITHGSPRELRRLYGLDTEGLIQAIREEGGGPSHG